MISILNFDTGNAICKYSIHICICEYVCERVKLNNFVFIFTPLSSVNVCECQCHCHALLLLLLLIVDNAIVTPLWPPPARAPAPACPSAPWQLTCDWPDDTLVWWQPMTAGAYTMTIKRCYINCTRTCTHAHMFKYILTYMCIHMYIFGCVSVWKNCIPATLLAGIFTFTYTCTHVHMHAHKV